MINYDRYYGGKRTMLTMSYDDGVLSDIRLIEIFDQYGIKGTFNLNAASIGTGRKDGAKDIAKVYQNHEIASHTFSHPHLEKAPRVTMAQEIIKDREILESLCGYPVRGLAYPFGTYSAEAVSAAQSCGIVYGRTIRSTGVFPLPEDFMTWHPTCHHNQCLEVAKEYIKKLDYIWRIPLFFVWGHSYEFDNDGNWDMIEEFCRLIGGREDIWYATNIEIYDYLTAQRSLHVSADNKIVYNPSYRTVWFSSDGETVEIRGGETLKL